MTTFILILLAILAVCFFSQPAKTDHAYHAAFGQRWGLLSRFNRGFSCGAYSISVKQSFENCCCVGPSGSGKTSNVVLSSLISLSRRRASMLVNDASGGEVFQRISGYFKRINYDVRVYQLLSPDNSETFNPLDYVTSISTAQEVAQTLVTNISGPAKGDPFWSQSSTALIALMIRYVTLYQPVGLRNLYNVRRLIDTFAFDPKKIDKLIVATHDRDLLELYKATVSASERTLASIVSVARAALSLWNDPELCRSTASSSFDLSTIRDRPVIIFVITPLQSLHYVKPIITLLFQSYFNFILSKLPERRARPVFFILEESAVLQFVGLSLTISQIRKFRAGILLSMQQESSLKMQYHDEAPMIMDNCGTKMYLPNQPLSTCQNLSKLFGRYSHGSGNTQQRHLRSEDEIRMSKRAYVLIGNNAPLEVRLVPVHRNILHWSKINQVAIDLPHTPRPAPTAIELP